MNSGCIPTKALVRVAELIHLARRDNAHFGFTVAGVEVDFPRIIGRKDAVVADVVGRLTTSLEHTEHLQVIHGEARFTGARRLAVGERELNAEHIIIASGSRPSTPQIPGALEHGYLTSTTIMKLKHLPPRLVVVGAGPIGMEFAQMFARFGSQVTVLMRGDRVLPHEDPEIADALGAYVQSEGLTLVPRAQNLRIERSHEGPGPRPRTVVAEVDGERAEFPADEVLLALGREPNHDGLDLAAAGIATTSEGWIEVDATLRTSVPGVFAVGDAIGHESGSQLYTHVAVNQGGIAARNALAGTDERFETHALPGAVFTEPEVARVGLTEAEAQASGYDPVVARYPYDRVGRARAMGETTGFFKVIADRATNRIIGFHVFGASAAELVHLAITVMNTQSRSAQPILDAIFIHPTLAEGVQSAFEELLTALPARMAH